MEYVSDLEVLERLKIASKTDLDTKLASLLGLSRQSITKARATKSVPAAWIPMAAKLFNVSTDWLFFGCGPMQLNANTPDQLQKVAQDTTEICHRCAKLETKIDVLEEERRELSRENRELSSENRMLWKENGDLRERCAKLEDRLIHSTSDVVFFKDLGLLSSDASSGK